MIMRHRETLQSGIQHLPPQGSAGNCIPVNQGFHGHRNPNHESLTPRVSAHEQAAGRILWPTAWLELCPTGFIPGFWPMLMDRVENQVDNLAPICSCPREIRQGCQQGLQHKHNVPANCQLHLGAQQGTRCCPHVQAPRAHFSLSSTRESDTSSLISWLLKGAHLKEAQL